MSKIFLITGASGHLGTTICKELVNRGEHVRALVMKNDPLENYVLKEIKKYYGNVTDIDSLEDFFNTTEDEVIVIHCAGIVTIKAKQDNLVYDVNVNGTKNIVEMCKNKKVKKLVYVSSVHAIPTGIKGEMITETKEFDETKVKGYYAKTKCMATKIVLDSAMQGLNVTVVHPSGIIGPNDYGHSHLTQLIIDFYKGGLTASVKGGYDFVDVRDVALGILKAAEVKKTGECYILSSSYYEVSEILETLHKVTGKRKVKTVLPGWFVRLVAPLAEAYYKIRKQPPLFTSYSLYTLTSNSCFSHFKASKELDYKTRNMEETLKDTVEWLKLLNRI